MAVDLPFYKNKIEQLVPHSGSMCLIDRVDYWDEQTIRCASTSHQDPDNPLRLDGKLSSIHLLEYGAQAMAIHGGLIAKTSTQAVLAAVRDVSIIIDEIDHLTDEIIISATVEINT
jgi:predicted hotdog family 3-hydroxylacyl-ACP dehydratase